MPPKKKQQMQKTGIHFFADEYRKVSPFHSKMSVRDLIIQLLPRWHSMTLLERKPYEDLSKQYKRIRMLNNETIATPVIPSSEEASFLEHNKSEERFLDTYLANDLNDIYKRDLFFVTFQIFCRTDHEDGGDYYPAEIAIMKYSFFEGVKEEYFTIIKPEKFPVGYTCTAIELSRETHQIPPFDFITANGNYKQIWQEVKRVIGEQVVDSSSTNEPIIIFSNVFERDQTTYLLHWLYSKGNVVDEQQLSKSPIFRVCSFEGLVTGLLRRLDMGAFAPHSVREQLLRPVYTIQVKERCVYHDSLAIQYCSRAINHGFRLFLEGFIGRRFLEKVPKLIKSERTQPLALSSIESLMHEIKSISNETILSAIDSISSIFIERRKHISTIAHTQKKIESTKTKLANIGSHVFVQSPSIEYSSANEKNCFDSSSRNKFVKSQMTSSLPKNSYIYYEDRSKIAARGIRNIPTYLSTINSNDNNLDSYIFVNSIGRGRGITKVVPLMPTFSK